MSKDLKDQLAKKAAPTNDGALVKKPKTIVEEINDLVPQFRRASPAWFKQIGGGDTLARIAITEFRKNPKLAECSKDSFYGALMTCAQVGLVPGPLGEVYLIPRKGVCCFEMGYKGLINLARRSGEVSVIAAQPVFEGERCQIDLGGTVDHPYDHTIDRTDPSKLLYVYAKATMRDGSTALEVMSKAEIDAIRKRSQASANGPWVTDYIMMARKTVMKRLLTKGQVPLSTEALTKITADETVRSDISLEPISAFDVPEQPSQPVGKSTPVEIIDEATGEVLEETQAEAEPQQKDPLFK